MDRTHSLVACAVVCHALLPRSRSHLYELVVLGSTTAFSSFVRTIPRQPDLLSLVRAIEIYQTRYERVAGDPEEYKLVDSLPSWYTLPLRLPHTLVFPNLQSVKLSTSHQVWSMKRDRIGLTNYHPRTLASYPFFGNASRLELTNIQFALRTHLFQMLSSFRHLDHLELRSCIFLGSAYRPRSYSKRPPSIKHLKLWEDFNVGRELLYWMSAWANVCSLPEFIDANQSSVTGKNGVALNIFLLAIGGSLKRLDLEMVPEAVVPGEHARRLIIPQIHSPHCIPPLDYIYRFVSQQKLRAPYTFLRRGCFSRLVRRGHLENAEERSRSQQLIPRS